ncbi:hypothetical protein HZC53_05505 [Candidatus Uhrbacteria bacterium]|nr:hypothetical protein [Candidatus Uhrbacteria bacterium]
MSTMVYTLQFAFSNAPRTLQPYLESLSTFGQDDRAWIQLTGKLDARRHTRVPAGEITISAAISLLGGPKNPDDPSTQRRDENWIIEGCMKEPIIHRIDGKFWRAHSKRWFFGKLNMSQGTGSVDISWVIED